MVQTHVDGLLSDNKVDLLLDFGMIFAMGSIANKWMRSIMRDFNKMRASLLHIVIHEGVEVKALAAAIGIDRSALTVFLYGRPSRRKGVTDKTPVLGTLDEIPSRKVDAYLHQWELSKLPPGRPRQSAAALHRFQELGRRARRKPPKTERDRFAEVLAAQAADADGKAYPDITPWALEVEGAPGYKPEGGLTSEDYTAFAGLLDDDDREALQEAVEEAGEFRRKAAKRKKV